jgi:hypothetical protein
MRAFQSDNRRRHMDLLRWTLDFIGVQGELREKVMRLVFAELRRRPA